MFLAVNYYAPLKSPYRFGRRSTRVVRFVISKPTSTSGTRYSKEETLLTKNAQMPKCPNAQMHAFIENTLYCLLHVNAFADSRERGYPSASNTTHLSRYRYRLFAVPQTSSPSWTQAGCRRCLFFMSCVRAIDGEIQCKCTRFIGPFVRVCLSYMEKQKTKHQITQLNQINQHLSPHPPPSNPSYESNRLHLLRTPQRTKTT